MRLPFWIAVLCLSLTGCATGPQILNAVSLAGPAVSATDLAYGAGPRRTLDVYAPPDARAAPVVVFFYGGSWQGGSKSDYRFVGAALAERGFVTVVPDYRVYPEVRFPEFLNDAAAAVRWARDNAARFGGDGRRVFLVGHSAGAHITAMLSLDGRWLRGAGLDPRRDILGNVGLAGPYDFLPLTDPALQQVFPESRRRESQPIAYAGNRAPAMFLATGADDTTVEPGNTLRLAARLRASGNSVETRLYPGTSHAMIIGAVSPALRGTAPVLDDVTRFMRARLGDGRSGT